MVPLLFALAALITTISATCYTFNGTDRNSYGDAGPGVYTPCPSVNSADGFSMCCRSYMDICQQDTGLCFNDASKQYWRESCTDPTWESPNCLKLFTNATKANITDLQVTKCSDGRWCYDNANVGCCENKEGYFIVNREQTLTDPNATLIDQTTSSSIGTSSSSSASFVATASNPASTPLEGSSGLSTASKVGIGIGAAVAAFTVTGLVGFCCLRRAHRGQRRKNIYSGENRKSGPHEAQSDPVYEIDHTFHRSRGTDPVYEKPVDDFITHRQLSSFQGNG